MTPDAYAESFSLALAVEDLGRDRTIQSDGGILGASDALSCHAKAVFTLRGEVPSNVPKKGKAQRGTYLHAGTLGAMEALYPYMLIESSLVATLPSGIKIPLHPDVMDPKEPSVTDLKFVDDLDLIKRVGPSDNQMAQRNLQYLAGVQAGHLAPEGITRNLFVDCTDLDRTWAHQTPFDMDWIVRADEWFQSAAQTAANLEDGHREWAEPMCRSYCPFYDKCRPPMLELNQPITIPHLIDAVIEGFAAREQRKAAALVEKQAVERLRGVSGRVGDVQVVSTTVNAVKGAYEKVTFRALT